MAVTVAVAAQVAVAAHVAVAALFLNIHLCTISCQDKFITFPNDLGQVTFVYFMCGATIQERKNFGFSCAKLRYDYNLSPYIESYY